LKLLNKEGFVGSEDCQALNALRAPLIDPAFLAYASEVHPGCGLAVAVTVTG
jgi:hypothetical protein